MAGHVPQPLVAVDIGNTRYKFGLFRRGTSAKSLPEPYESDEVPCDAQSFPRLESWLASAPPGLTWWIGSVNRPATTRLIDWLRDRTPPGALRLISCSDLPLKVALERPDMVGIDRLLAAVAANQLRTADRPAVVVGLGSAITVNLLDATGAFRGGAILPGISMSARALHDYTDLLPLVTMHDLGEAPDPLGRVTVEAMRSGLFWGAIGSIRQLIERYELQYGATADVFLTGGAAESVSQLIRPDARYLRHLTLYGVALAAQAAASSSTLR